MKIIAFIEREDLIKKILKLMDTNQKAEIFNTTVCMLHKYPINTSGCLLQECYNSAVFKDTSRNMCYISLEINNHHRYYEGFPEL